ncbi:MAG TPA: hypothetical protein VGQ83_19230 [Polyangia bacterium]|jgi:predicted RNase H-like HicB family nuclease
MTIRIKVLRDGAAWGAVVSGLPDRSTAFVHGATRSEAVHNAKVAALEAIAECMQNERRDLRLSSVLFAAAPAT